MNFHLDESGDFRVPTDGTTHAAGIVMGIVIPDETQAEVLRCFDEFVRQLPQAAFHNGEPKGKLLDEERREQFGSMISHLDSVLVCPIMLDLTSLAGRTDVDVRQSVVKKLREWASLCKHETMRDEVQMLARQFGNLSTEQALRLATWARCIMRCIQDSVIWHCGPEYHSSWANFRFEIDPVQRASGSREEQVFQYMLPAWVTGWSVNDPLTTIEEIHTAEHPFEKLYGTDGGIDLGKIVRDNLHYPCSHTSAGLQMADMGATIVAAGVRGLANVVDLQNYGIMMLRSIGRPVQATGIFSLVEPSLDDLKKRYYRLPEAIDVVRSVHARRSRYP